MFSLDYKSRLPIYEQLYNSITRLAALGGIEPNEQLPSVRTLAQQLSVNPNTVQKAYQNLERDGIIYSIPGKGSFIVPDISILAQKKELVRKKLAETIQSAVDIGITKEEILQMVHDFFVEGGGTHD